MQKITPFLMFAGQAEEAMEFYVSVFPDSEIASLVRYGEGEAGTPGTVQRALFSLNGQRFMCIDSNVEHGFTFTPALSLHVRCSTMKEIDALYAKLAEGGQTFMPLDAYPFSQRYAWIADKYGVSWQLSLQ